MQKKPRILVAPLDWGLGHASRCVPIIQELLRQDLEPVLGGSPESLFLLKTEFPQLDSFELPPYAVSYSRKSNQIARIGLQIPRLIKVIRKEKRCLEDAIDKQLFAGVIADNRYGLYSSRIPSIFICHQLSLALPPKLRFLSKIVDKTHRSFMKKFSACWVPDYKGKSSLAGKLSQQKMDMSQRYLGPLSRFYKQEEEQVSLEGLPPEPPEILVVLSGPEPQRTLLEEKIREQAQTLSNKFWIVQGKVGPFTCETIGNCQVISFLDSKQLSWAFASCLVCISRSGYSSLMDYEAMGISNLLLIPTPGQTEQEYLAERWSKLGKALVQKQKDLDLKAALVTLLPLEKVKKAPYLTAYPPPQGLKTAIAKFRETYFPYSFL